MTEDQIRTMKRHGIFIGFRGYDHYWLGNLPPEKMREDVDKVLDTLNEFIDRKRWVANFPYGNYNDCFAWYEKKRFIKKVCRLLMPYTIMLAVSVIRYTVLGNQLTIATNIET